MLTRIGFIAVLGLLLLGLRPGPAPAQEPLPLLRWDVLRDTHYDPRREIVWPDAVRRADGTRVRMEGYLMPLFGTQDPGDLLLVGLHPMSLLCGPTDLTALVEVHLDGFTLEDGEWPRLPVEVTGTFRLSRTPRDRHAIYQMRALSWKPLRRWEQDFPALESEDLSLPDGPGP